MKTYFLFKAIILLIVFSGCSSDDDNPQGESQCNSILISERFSLAITQTNCNNESVCETTFEIKNLTGCDFQVSYSLFFDGYDSVNNVQAGEPIVFSTTISSNSTKTESISHSEGLQINYEINNILYCKDLQGGCSW